jgi:muramoyltetrapeptide carboxypeptidase
MIYPNKLDKNDVIEIISPSNGVKNNKILKYELAINCLSKLGFNILEDKYTRKSVNGVSSSAENRATELNKAIINKNVKALIACSGGDFLNQVLDLINWKKVKNNVKWIQGQSDITSLLFYITTKYDIATIYSFNAKTFGDDNLPESMIKNNIKFLTGEMPLQIEYDCKLDTSNMCQTWECITNNDIIAGRIIGGCLDSLKDIIGTKYDVIKKFINKYKSDGIVWYFDVAEMTNEDIQRTMWQFKKAGWFNECCGILFGRVENEITYTNTSLRNAIKYNLSDLNIPILINVDIGHTNPVFTIINGSKIKISKNEKHDKYVMETIFK